MAGSTRARSAGSRISACTPRPRWRARVFSRAGRMAALTPISAPERTKPDCPATDEAALQHQHASETGAGELEGERAAGDAAAHDDGVGRAHGTSRRRMRSPCLMSPARSTRAYTRLQPGCVFCETRE